MRLSTSQLALQGVNNILSQQASLSKTQAQLASGRQILTPSDDPAGASRILELEKAINTVERYNRNADQAETRLALSENILNEFGNTLQRVRELSVQAANGSQDRETRAYIASELRQAQDQLVQLANTDDGNGEFLFAGSETRTQPFTKTAGGKVIYNGDQGQREVRIGPSRTLPVDSSGFDAFMKIPNGNGQYQARESADNQGSGFVTVVDREVRRLDPAVDEYRLVFDEDEDGRMRYGVQSTPDADDPDAWEWVRPPRGADGQAPSIEDAPVYERGAAIEVDDGVRVVVDGEPEPGDTFTVSQSRPQSIFETVNDLIGALETGEGPEFRNAINRALGDIDLAMENTHQMRADLGARLSTLDSERASNEAALIDLEQAKSNEEDLDYAEATGRFNQELTGLEAAQSTFSRVQDLSLFNYI